jgi:hypothetical protein
MVQGVGVPLAALAGDVEGDVGALLVEAEVGASSVVLGAADSGARLSVADCWADGGLAGMEVAGERLASDGGDGAVPARGVPVLRAPMVVVPDEWEAPTSAETGRCPISSIPVTMPMATRKTVAALRATRDHRRGRTRPRVRRGSSSGGIRRSLLGGAGWGVRRGPANWVRAWSSRRLVRCSDEE